MHLCIEYAIANNGMVVEKKKPVLPGLVNKLSKLGSLRIRKRTKYPPC